MELKEIRKEVAKDLKKVRSDWSFLEKIEYWRDIYANACASLLAKGYVESAKIQAQIWRYVDNLRKYLLEKNWREFETKKSYQKILGWR
jgi:mannitol/fructose-specific phosphotransferase system IIA component (Ntr-type)